MRFLVRDTDMSKLQSYEYYSNYYGTEEEEHKLEMWEECLSYLMSDVMRRLCITTDQISEILVSHESLRKSLSQILTELSR